MNLHLILTFMWWDMVKSGEKRVEYRDITPYWRKRIWNKRADIKAVSFARGYTSIMLKYNVWKIDIGSCPYNGWEGKFFRVHFD